MIASSFEWLVTLVVRRPALFAVLASLFTLAGAGLALTTNLADDARSLVADADPAVHAQLTALSEFTAVDNLLVILDSPGNPGSLQPASEVVLAELNRHPEAIKRARCDVAPAEQLAVVEALLPRRFILDTRDPVALFEPEALQARLAEVRARLLAPQGLIEKQFLLADPFGSLGESLGALGAAPGLPKLDASSGRFFSADGGSLLIVAEPVGNPFGGSDAARTMAVMAQAEQALQAVAPEVTLRVIGAHRFTHDAESYVRHDVHFGVITSIASILLIFWIFFRSVRYIVVALPPLLFGAAAAGATAALLREPVHGIVLAFAGSCLGLAIDYTVYLMAATAEVGGGARQALPRAAYQLGKSLHLLVGTTVIGMSVLLASHVKAMQQMGLIGCVGVAGACLGTLLWVPILLPLVSPSGSMPPVPDGPWSTIARLGARSPRPVLVAIGLLAVGLLAASFNTRIDGDLRNLDTHTARAQEDERRFVEAFGDPGSSALALIEASTLDAGLATAEATTTLLKQHGVHRVLSVSGLAPPEATVSARKRGWCQYFAARRKQFRHTASTVGFRAEAFAVFEADWRSLCEAATLPAPEPALVVLSNILGREVVKPTDRGVRLAVAFDVTDTVLEEVKQSLIHSPGVTVVHRRELNQRLVAVIARDLPLLGGLSAVLVFLLLAVGLRSVPRALMALGPAALAILAFFGILGIMGTPINLLNLCVLPLLNGSGTDYGIVMAGPDGRYDDRAHRARAFGLTIAALTTLAGFGPMAFADYYALATIGRSVLIAIGSAAFFALLLVPALQRFRR